MVPGTSRNGSPPPRGGGPRAVRWLFAFAASIAALSASSADLQVNPILVEFLPGEQSQALWLTNSGTATLKAQVRVARWTQQDGQESQAPTRELVASPAILEVAAGQRQLVRLIRPGVGPVPSELAYRLTVDELPPAADAAQDPGLQFLMRYSVPVFILADGTQPLSPSRRTAAPPAVGDTGPALQSRLEPQGDGHLLVVRNPGRQRVRLSGLTWEDASGARTELVPGLLGYVLAGQTMRWPLPLSSQLQARGGNLRVRLNDDPQDQVLPLGAAGR